MVENNSAPPNGCPTDFLYVLVRWANLMRKSDSMLMLSFARQGRQRAHAVDNQGRQKASFAHAVDNVYLGGKPIRCAKKTGYSYSVSLGKADRVHKCAVDNQNYKHMR